jgi:hypothetical protein
MIKIYSAIFLLCMSEVGAMYHLPSRRGMPFSNPRLGERSMVEMDEFSGVEKFFCDKLYQFEQHAKQMDIEDAKKYAAEQLCDYMYTNELVERVVSSQMLALFERYGFDVNVAWVGRSRNFWFNDLLSTLLDRGISLPLRCYHDVLYIEPPENFLFGIEGGVLLKDKRFSKRADKFLRKSWRKRSEGDYLKMIMLQYPEFVQSSPDLLVGKTYGYSDEYTVTAEDVAHIKECAEINRKRRLKVAHEEVVGKQNVVNFLRSRELGKR